MFAFLWGGCGASRYPAGIHDSAARADMPVRVEAVRLMERANDVSLAAHLMPNYKLEGTFRAYGLDGSIQNGTFNTVYSVDSERYE
jgi:hypothetical protein